MGGGKSGQGGGTSYQTSQVQIPPEVMARYNAVNSRAEAAAATPWQAYTGELVAPVNQTQQGGINTISGAAGVDTPYFNQATNAIDQGLSQATPLYQTGASQVAGGLAAGNQYTTQGLQTASGAAGASMPFNGLAAGQINASYGNAQPYNQFATGLAAGSAGAVNPGELDINRYMSPYNEGVVQSTLGLLKQDQKMAQADLRDQQILGGSFGGDRSGVGAANLQRQQDLAYGNVAAGLYNANYGQALGAAQQQQGVGLSAGQANRAALGSAAGQIAGIGQQQFAQGSATAQGNLGIGQQIYGQGQGLAAAQMQGGNQLYSQGVGAAGTYGQLGTQQLQNQLAQGQAQIGAGTVEQQTKQAQDTAAYEQFMQERGYPFQVAQFLANIAMGTGAQSGSTTNTVATQPQPYFSDERLKENVHVIGKTHDGQPIIRFNYKGDPSTQIGLSAQETEKHHPEAVGLASGFKTVDYDAATRDSIAKAGGGGLGGGMEGILAQQRAMFPGGHDPRGITSGVGPRGVAMAPLKAQAPQSAKVDMARPAQQTGAKQDIDSVLGMYKTGKGMADMYSEGKDTLVGTAGKDGKPGTGGWFGKDGKWNPGEGSAAKLFSNDNTGLAGGKITVDNLAPPPGAEPVTVADAGVPDLTGAATADAGLASGMEWGSMFANRGGRMQRAAGGAMPYSGSEGYIPEELLKPVDPEKPDEGGKGAMMKGPSGGGGGSGGGVGKGLASLAGMGAGMMMGGPFGAMIGGTAGGMLGGMFEKGGRVGLATGGWQGEGDTIEEEPGNVLPFRRREPEHTPMPRMTPVSEAGLAAGAGFPVNIPELPPKDEGHRTAPFEFSQDRLPSMDRYAARVPGTPGGLGTPGSTGTADFPPPAGNPAAGPGATSAADFPPRPRGTMFPESGTIPPAEGLAGGLSVTSGTPSGPTLPDGTPIVDTPPTGLAAAPEAAPAPAPAGGAPALGAGARPTMPAGFNRPGGQADVDHSPDAVWNRMKTRESNNRHFRDDGMPTTSSAGAVGLTQVMPKTGPEAAQLAGLPWNPELFNRKRTGDPVLDKEAEDYNAALGSAYYKEQLRKFGDPYMASAAYNAGPGAVEAALKKAGEQGGSYLSHLPKETQDYVAFVSNNTRGAPALALNDNRPTVPQPGLASGQSQQPQAPTADPQPVPDFIDRAGNWINDNQRPIMAGLAFIGNMLGSKSHQLTGAIGDGLAAAAPMYMATGFKETELKQGQERIDIGARAQYMAVLARQQQMQNDYIRAHGAPSPELAEQMQRTLALINGKGGVAAVPGGMQSAESRPPSPTPARTDLAPSAPAATPPQAPGSATTSAPPAAPTPGVYTGGPPPITAEFLSKLDPKENPELLQRAADRQRANGDTAGADQLEQQAREARARINQTGQGKGPMGENVKLPGWDTYKAQQANLEPNQKWLQQSEAATDARVKARQNLNQIRDIVENYETGTGADWKAAASGWLRAAGLPALRTDTTDQDAFKSFLKDAYSQILSTPNVAGASTDQLRQEIGNAFASPTLPPEANKKILSQVMGTLDYEDAYAAQLAEAIKANQLVDQKIVGDQWRAKDKEKNNPEYFRSKAYRDTAVLGATPDNPADLKNDHLYMLTPEQVARFTGAPLPQVKEAFKEANKRAIKYRVTRDDTGAIRLKAEGKK